MLTFHVIMVNTYNIFLHFIHGVIGFSNKKINILSIKINSKISSLILSWYFYLYN